MAALGALMAALCELLATLGCSWRTLGHSLGALGGSWVALVSPSPSAGLGGKSCPNAPPYQLNFTILSFAAVLSRKSRASQHLVVLKTTKSDITAREGGREG